MCPSPVDWEKSHEFGLLCDLVATDSLVCVTGAGISRSLERKTPSPTGETKLPGWIPLLRELFEAVKSKMDPTVAQSVTRLLSPDDERHPVIELQRLANQVPLRDEITEQLGKIGPAITSRELITAATLIRQVDPRGFDAAFRVAVTEAPGQTSETHRALLELEPRGVVTFNYDQAHETACRGIKKPHVLDPNLKTADADFSRVLRDRLREFFIVKAHGSLGAGKASRLTLTFEDYRDLIARNPAYRTFIQNLFTNFHLLLFGYGLDDPDFDLFLWTMAEQFGSPLHEHVVIRPASQVSRKQEVERALYGIRTLTINDWRELPDVLRRACQNVGPNLEQTIQLCYGATNFDRDRGHSKLRDLGPAGRKVAAAEFLKKLDDRSAGTWARSEAAYSLGVLSARDHKDRLMKLVDAENSSDILGRTLTQLRGVLVPKDIRKLKGWKRRFEKTPPDGERSERILHYIDYLLCYVPHKANSDQKPSP